MLRYGYAIVIPVMSRRVIDKLYVTAISQNTLMVCLEKVGTHNVDSTCESSDGMLLTDMMSGIFASLSNHSEGISRRSTMPSSKTINTLFG
jgi:hypothetical protein